MDQDEFRCRGTGSPAAARDGIESRLYWPGLGEVTADELALRRQPSPLADEGLRRWGLPPRSATDTGADRGPRQDPAATARPGGRCAPSRRHNAEDCPAPALAEMLRRVLRADACNDPSTPGTVS